MISGISNSKKKLSFKLKLAIEAGLDEKLFFPSENLKLTGELRFGNSTLISFYLKIEDFINFNKKIDNTVK